MKTLVMACVVSLGLGFGVASLMDNKEVAKVETVTEQAKEVKTDEVVPVVKNEFTEIKDFHETYQDETDFYKTQSRWLPENKDNYLDYVAVKAIKLTVDDKEVWALTDVAGWTYWDYENKIGLHEGMNYVVQVGRVTQDIYEVWYANFDFTYEDDFKNEKYLKIEKEGILYEMNNNDVTSLENNNFEAM